MYLQGLRKGIFLFLAGMSPVLIAAGCSAPAGEPGAPLVDPAAEQLYDTSPVRGELRALELQVGTDSFSCSMCHDGFSGELSEAALEGSHSHIKFDHGLNLRCLNCHNAQDSDAFVHHDGSIIPGDQPTQLCAKCHGVHYREWRLGVHGRKDGFWDEAFGQRKQVHCIQCHDPHKPRFQPMAPEPAIPLTRFENLLNGASSDAE